MSQSANVLAIHALDELKGALARFGGEAREALEAVEREIRRTLEWLEERHTHWQREVRRRQEDVHRARAALERCQASARYDPQPAGITFPIAAATSVRYTRRRGICGKPKRS